MRICRARHVFSGGLEAARRCPLAIGVVLAAALAVPAGATGDAAPESVTGSGVVAATQFKIAVAGGPFGQDPSGSLRLQGFFNFTATPTCMNIADNAGVVGFRIDNGPMAGQGFLAASEPDASGHTVQYSSVLTAPPTACPPDDAPAPPGGIENGGGGGVFAGQITDAGGPPSPLPLAQHQFSTSAVSAGVRAIAQAQDGTVWFIEPDANRLVSISDDASGTMHQYDVPTAGAGISSIAADLSHCTPTGCAGGMWFTELNANQVGHVSPDGSMSEYPLPTAQARPSAIASDLTGGAWFTEPGADRIGRVAAAGQVIEYQLPTRGVEPIAIAADDDTTAGGAWFAEAAAKRIGFIDDRGRISEYSLPPGAGSPTAIVADGAGAGAWFLEPSTNTIGHIDRPGDINQYPIPTADASPQGLASGTGPDASSGGAWFSETSTGQLGFISSSGQFSQFTTPGAHPDALAFVPSIDVPPTDGYSKYQAIWWTDPAGPNVGYATFPLSVSSGVPLIPPPPPPSYVRASLARRLTVRGNRIRLTLRCAGVSGRCAGQVALTVAGARAADATSPLAKATFRIAPNQRRKLVLSMNRTGQQLLRTHRRGLPVTIDISSHGHFTTSRRTATLRLR